MITIPTQTRRWSQPNNSDLFGNIYVTKNVTFDRDGYLQLSASPRCAMNISVDADWDNVATMVYSENISGYLAVTWDAVFNVNYYPLLTYPVQNSDTGIFPGDTQSGAVWFGGLLVVSQDTDVDYYDPNTSTWTDTNITLTNSGQHQVVNFLSLSAVAICDVNTVKLYSSPMSATPTLITTLTINSDFAITGACYLNQNMYIATRNIYGGHAFLYVWNGLGTAAQQAYEVDANMIFDVCVHRNTVVCFVSNGELMQFTGGGLQQLATFPVFYENQNLTDTSNIGMYKNCMKSNGDLIYINFTNDRNTFRMVDLPDGIWCYDPKVGLYHRYANSISMVDIKTVASASISAATNIITTTAVPITGTEVIYTSESTGTINELTKETKYFVIKVSSTEMKLATTKANALAGTAIDLITIEAGKSYNFNCFPNIDYGSTFSSRTFTVSVIESSTQYPQYGIDAIWSTQCNTRTNSMVGNEVLITASPVLESRGYFITPKILSDNTTDTFNNFVLKFTPFHNELDKILIKYRTQDDNKKFFNTSDWVATWTSSTTFTTTQTDIANASVGDEVEFLEGAAAGLLSHIVSVSAPNAGVYTVTISEGYDNYAAGDKSAFIYRNWKLWKTISYTDKVGQDGYIAEQLGKTGKFVQFKIELRGVGVRIEELKINNKTHLPS